MRISKFDLFNSKDDLTPSELAKVISENAFVCMYLSFQLSQLVEMFGPISKLLGVSYRVNEMIYELDKRSGNNHQDSIDNQLTGLPESTSLKITKLSVFKPDDEVVDKSDASSCLVENLNLELGTKHNLLINGKSSSGKTSLMRVLAHLWPKTSGTFQINFTPYFMPQNSYLCQDDITLRQQIIFPDIEPDLSKGKYKFYQLIIFLFVKIVV